MARNGENERDAAALGAAAGARAGNGEPAGVPRVSGERVAGVGPGAGAAEAAELLALVEGERERTARALEPDPRVIFGSWGIAWLAGFLVMWAAATDRGPLSFGVSGAVFGACILGAIVVTMVHIARRVVGLRGVSSQVGAMYGWAWFLSFATLTAIMAGAHRAGLPDDTAALLWSVLSGLVVGALYLAGGALWQDTVQFRLGAWILIAAGAGALAGYPEVYLVMGLGGGGGFLAAAAWYALRGRRP